MAIDFEGLERFYETLGARLDSMAEDERAPYLARLALLLANEVENEEILLRSLKDAGS